MSSSGTPCPRVNESPNDRNAGHAGRRVQLELVIAQMTRIRGVRSFVEIAQGRVARPADYADRP